MDDFPTDGTSAFIIENWLSPHSSSIKSLFEWRYPEEVPLRICIAGAPGSHKHKVGNWLGKKLDLPVITSVARTVNKLDYPINLKADWESQLLITLGELFEEGEYNEFITVSPVINSLAHIKVLCDRNGIDNKHLERALANVGNRIAHDSYSVVFYVQRNEISKRDGIRSTDKKYLAEIDSNIRQYLALFDVDYMPLSGSLDEKREAAWSYLDGFGLLEGREEDDDDEGWEDD